MYHLHRTENKAVGVVIEGHYEQLGDVYLLREWRVTSTYEGRTTVGRWHRVHKNQRKDIGGLRLVRWTAPTVA
jgi:hypothetical protein